MILSDSEYHLHKLQQNLPPFDTILENYRVNEKNCVQNLLKASPFTHENHQTIKEETINLVQKSRQHKPKAMSIENFLHSHNLSSQEGLAMMCLAEALLRIPDSSTKTQFIRDKVGGNNWQSQEDDPLFIKFANIGLFSTSKFLNIGLKTGIVSTFSGLLRRFGEPVIRQIMTQAVRIMGQQFVMGETIEKALSRAKDNESKGYRHSFDMLGEGARTNEDALRYFETYKSACKAIGESHKKEGNIFSRPSLSVKLSAIHSRYDLFKKDKVINELVERVLELAKLAKSYEIGLTIDAEESERLTLSLEIFAKVLSHPDLEGYEGLGLAVQAYQKRAVSVIEWLIELSKLTKKHIPVRLVKGAYWDSEIKRTQVNGLDDYPVFTQKAYTDISYIACAKLMLEAKDHIYAQFATHNAQTASSIQVLAKEYNVNEFEFQRLHGMGDGLYEEMTVNQGRPCRIYAPVGIYKDLLAYLVRRLLENGANTSFVNQLHNLKIPAENFAVDPIHIAKQLQGEPHPKIVLPEHLYGESRKNSKGLDLYCENILGDLNQKIKADVNKYAMPQAIDDQALQAEVEKSLGHFESWRKVSVHERAAIIQRLGDLMQSRMVELIDILVAEGQKTLSDAISEVREAIDFCYYYAKQAIDLQNEAKILPGPTGELNQLTYHPRGVYVCISPWNFPLAIFLGQVVAALVTGNTVLAKPAHQTQRIAKFAVDLAYEAGLPKGILRLLVTSGRKISEVILTDSRISGVVFTGSTETAQVIHQVLAARKGPIIPLIAETGGINAMIVDSSALPEQVVQDVVASAFQSAGQRCSALRLLCLQYDTADTIIHMLKGAMDELSIGPSYLLSTDVGPVIDEEAHKGIQEYIELLESTPDLGRLIHRCSLPENLNGNFIAPQLWQVGSPLHVSREVFGPVLHVVKYKGEYLDQVLQDINKLGYGLTLGLHTRLESTMQHVYQTANVGNIYVNRNMIGAVVGVQPFGGEGLSGTGFKAGGPNYLLKFVTERTYCQDTTAAGGNASLLTEI